MIKYLGSKRLLITSLLEIISEISKDTKVLDLFSGTSRVGYALKGHHYRVVSNDHNTYSATLARCYVQADYEDHTRHAQQLVKEFNSLSGSNGYFTETFCVKSRFFQPKNGEKVDAIRDEIAKKSLDPELEAILLTSLMEAADRVDSTTGIQMAYLKSWATRSFNDLELRVPKLLPQARSGKSLAYQLDALQAAQDHEVDIAYLDPPYNQHKYLGNYHIWESLVLWDKPEVYGVACKRVDCRERKSVFNSKPNSASAFKNLLSSLQSKHVVVSFNNEGYLGRADIEQMLCNLHPFVFVFVHNFKRYVGAQIGIHDPKGTRVGEVSHTKNLEYIYVATSDPQVAKRMDYLYERYEKIDLVQATHH